MVKLDALVIPIEHDAMHFMMGMSLIQKAALATVGVITAAFAGLAAFGVKSAMEAARVDELAIVNQVLAKNAGLAGEAVKAEAAEVRSMGIEFAASQQIVAYFIKAQLDLTKASDLARVAQDAAVISGKNSTEAAQDMIWGITTLNIRVLRNAGINITAAEAYEHYAKATGKSAKNLTALEKQQAFLNEVLLKGKDIAGAYTAAMTSPAKMLRSFPRFINDILVGVGRHLTPAMGTVVFSLAGFLKELGKQVADGGALAPGLAKIGVILRDIAGSALAFLANIDWDVLGEKLSGIADGFGKTWLGLKNFFLTGELPSNEEIVAWLDKIDHAVAEAIGTVNWKASGDAFGSKLISVLGGSVGGGNQTEIPAAIGQAISDWLLGAMGYVSWQSVWDTFAYNWRAGWAGIWNDLKIELSNFGIMWVAGWKKMGWDILIVLHNFEVETTVKFRNFMNNLELNITNWLREIAKVWYDRTAGWINQAVIALNAGKKALLDAITSVKNEINTILRQIITSITVHINAIIPQWLKDLLGLGGGGNPNHPGRASGGAVRAGQVYNVNELGRPEYFIPSTSGRIEPQPSQSNAPVRIDRDDMRELARMIRQEGLKAA